MSQRVTTKTSIYDGKSFIHIRPQDQDAGRPMNRGGATVCYFPDPDKAVMRVGVAVCSKKDNFSKEQGRLLAMKRAFRQEKKAFSVPIPPELTDRTKCTRSDVIGWV